MALPPPSADSTCLVTGASSGIGADIARELSRRGLGLTLVARREDRLRELAAELGESTEVVAADIADEAGRRKLSAAVAERGLTVEVLVNNAGFSTAGRFWENEAERELALVRTNIEAVVALCREFLPGMVERGRGAVLNVASTASFQPLPMQASYAASKAFVLSFTDAIHAELAGTGVTATSLCPGPVKTEFVEVAGLERAEEEMPGFLWSTPEEVAKAAVAGLEKGRRVVIPGMLNRAGAIGGQLAPRAVVLRLAGRLHPANRL
ncbi:MAG: SDR family NAD(P)-dependent oxidoreductase [Thermoleophilaceae bacterium]